MTPPPKDPPRMPIDTGRTLHAEPGAGAGVFITYSAGGQWRVFWTCDTKVSSGHRCDVEIAVGTHGLQSLTGAPANVIAESDAQSFRVRAVTTTTIDSVSFRTDPGAPIALTMRIDGTVHPDLIWFVSNGELVQAPSDPIELVPSDP